MNKYGHSNEIKPVEKNISDPFKKHIEKIWKNMLSKYGRVRSVISL